MYHVTEATRRDTEHIQFTVGDADTDNATLYAVSAKAWNDTKTSMISNADTEGATWIATDEALNEFSLKL